MTSPSPGAVGCKLVDRFQWLFTETGKKESLPNLSPFEDLDTKSYFPVVSKEHR